MKGAEQFNYSRSFANRQVGYTHKVSVGYKTWKRHSNTSNTNRDTDRHKVRNAEGRDRLRHRNRSTKIVTDKTAKYSLLYIL